MEPDVCFCAFFHAYSWWYLLAQTDKYTYMNVLLGAGSHIYKHRSLQGSLGLITGLDDMIRNRIGQKWPQRACLCLLSMLTRQPFLPTAQMMLLLLRMGLYWPRNEQHRQWVWKQWKMDNWKPGEGLVKTCTERSTTTNFSENLVPAFLKKSFFGRTSEKVNCSLELRRWTRNLTTCHCRISGCCYSSDAPALYRSPTNICQIAVEVPWAKQTE